jgi:hypothetical protein
MCFSLKKKKTVLSNGKRVIGVKLKFTVAIRLDHVQMKREVKVQVVLEIASTCVKGAKVLRYFYQNEEKRVTRHALIPNLVF